eukprot:scaffold47546_cov28-Tisochrysis_lutea.AAC.3
MDKAAQARALSERWERNTKEWERRGKKTRRMGKGKGPDDTHRRQKNEGKPPRNTGRGGENSLKRERLFDT